MNKRQLETIIACILAHGVAIYFFGFNVVGFIVVSVIAGFGVYLERNK